MAIGKTLLSDKMFRLNDELADIMFSEDDDLDLSVTKRLCLTELNYLNLFADMLERQEMLNSKLEKALDIYIQKNGE